MEGERERIGGRTKGGGRRRIERDGGREEETEDARE